MASYKQLLTKIDKASLPRHVGVIMDGNGRWAKKRSIKRLMGHYKGKESVRAILEAGIDIGLECLTIYAFSTENWQRPEDEVNGLLKLIRDSLAAEINGMHKNNVIVRFIGSTDGLDKDYLDTINKTCAITANNTGMRFNIAFNYGGKQEICDAVNKLLQNGHTGPITVDDISNNLYASECPPADLIIRTSGEIRLSNFLLWQGAYAEFYFTDVLWPDFGKAEFATALVEFAKRKRRFGGV